MAQSNHKNKMDNSCEATLDEKNLSLDDLKFTNSEKICLIVFIVTFIFVDIFIIFFICAILGYFNIFA